MSGRGNLRQGGGGRGRKSGRRIPPQSNKPVNRKKTIEEYYFYIGSSKQASDYETPSEYIINYIKKTFYKGNMSPKHCKHRSRQILKHGNQH